ncbi:MAG TPA: hypothetical protein PKD86_03565 [Gemmatales bacterium]|nr:hypothetical protein [Gemmatales bacterium]HMP58411.1 hypothetical protein [Gemmatales bacterium]
MMPIAVAIAGFSLSLLAPLLADVRSAAAREAAEYVMRKFGREVTQETVETLAKRLEKLAVTHGDEVFQAARKVGPRALTVAESAGKEATMAYRLMAKHGDAAVAWVVSRPSAMRLVARFGEEAGEVMVKHPGIAEPMIEALGKPAVTALREVGPQNARRLAMLVEDGSLAAIGRSPEVLGVVGRYGDRAMDFIWRNKGSLTVATALTAFLVSPEPFIDGAKNLADVAGQSVVRPLVETPGRVLGAIATTIPWYGWVASLGGLGGLWLLLRQRRRRPVPRPA